MTIWRGATAEVERRGDKIYKTYDESPFGIPGETLATAEAFWLLRLSDLGIVPSLLGLQNRTLIMSYEGEPGPFPTNWLKQAEEITRYFKFYNVFHRDLYSSRWGDVKNVLIRDGKLKLIDFTWATSHRVPAPPPAFAPHLGEYSDLEALELVYEARR